MCARIFQINRNLKIIKVYYEMFVYISVYSSVFEVCFPLSETSIQYLVLIIKQVVNVQKILLKIL